MTAEILESDTCNMLLEAQPLHSMRQPSSIQCLRLNLFLGCENIDPACHHFRYLRMAFPLFSLPSLFVRLRSTATSLETTRN
jgi:hypothetical protein